MQHVVIVIHLMLVLALIGVVLLQRSEGGGLGIGGGGGFMTSRGTANVLTRATATLAALFFLTSLLLSILAASRVRSCKAAKAHPPFRRREPHHPWAAAACSSSCSRARPLRSRRPHRPRRGRRCRSRSDFSEGPGNRPFRIMGRKMEPQCLRVINGYAQAQGGSENFALVESNRGG
jgi:preprotein translocase subunit SecG